MVVKFHSMSSTLIFSQLSNKSLSEDTTSVIGSILLYCYSKSNIKDKGKAIPIQAWRGPEGSRIGLPYTYHKKREHFPCMLHKREDISAKRKMKTENIHTITILLHTTPIHFFARSS
jgi:hypothetical protein